jgi:hypothetical protein
MPTERTGVPVLLSRNMLVVNYWDAKVAVLPVDEAGRLHEKTHIHAQPGICAGTEARYDS